MTQASPVASDYALQLRPGKTQDMPFPATASCQGVAWKAETEAEGEAGCLFLVFINTKYAVIVPMKIAAISPKEKVPRTK
jgi:hypothetical protein